MMKALYSHTNKVKKTGAKQLIIYRSRIPVEIFKCHSTYDNKNNNATYHQRVVYQVFSSVSYRRSNNFTSIFNHLWYIISATISVGNQCTKLNKRTWNSVGKIFPQGENLPYLLLCAVVLQRFQIHVLQISLCQKIAQ